jgi:hypothetical protein
MTGRGQGQGQGREPLPLEGRATTTAPFWTSLSVMGPPAFWTSHLQSAMADGGHLLLCSSKRSSTLKRMRDERKCVLSSFLRSCSSRSSARVRSRWGLAFGTVDSCPGHEVDAGVDTSRAGEQLQQRLEDNLVALVRKLHQRRQAVARDDDVGDLDR